MDMIGRIYGQSGTNNPVKYSIVDADLGNILVRLQTSHNTNANVLNLYVPSNMKSDRQ